MVDSVACAFARMLCWNQSAFGTRRQDCSWKSREEMPRRFLQNYNICLHFCVGERNEATCWVKRQRTENIMSQDVTVTKTWNACYFVELDTVLAWGQPFGLLIPSSQLAWGGSSEDCVINEKRRERSWRMSSPGFYKHFGRIAPDLYRNEPFPCSLWSVPPPPPLFFFFSMLSFFHFYSVGSGKTEIEVSLRILMRQGTSWEQNVLWVGIECVTPASYM